MHVHLTNIQGDSTLEECGDGSCGGGDEGSGAAYWNVFVVSSRPGYSTFRATPIINIQQAAWSTPHSSDYTSVWWSELSGALNHVLV